MFCCPLSCDSRLENMRRTQFNRSYLEGEHISLEPVEKDHLDALVFAGQDPKIWEFMAFSLDSESSVRRFVDYVVALPDKGMGQAYIIRSKSTHQIVGGSGYWHVNHQHNKLEIGGSWVIPKQQRSVVNTEAKYLMLKNAFENLSCNRVGFSIDVRNEKSLRAVERIGAKREGVLRNDMQMHDGRLRDSAIYSIVINEWPNTKKRFKELLAKYT